METMTELQAERREAFTMDPGLLVSVMKSQAGTLSKALLEGVMNSIDAGATRVDVTIERETFTIEDNGRGFASAEEVRNWFGCFGTPHKEGDAIYGRFRMGRGQLFSFASTTWTSNRFRMAVDLNKFGLNYSLSEVAEPVKGCRIEAQLYDRLSDYQFNETLVELRRFVAYALKPVYINGALAGGPAERLKSWNAETDDAWFRLNSEMDELLVYNQGIFVRSYGSYKVGCGGVVVSKRPLEVNFARNDVMESKCSVWRRVQEHLTQLVYAKLAYSKKLSDGERSYLARQVFSQSYSLPSALRDSKVLTDPSGKHHPLSALRDFTTLAYTPKATPKACRLQGYMGHFVVTDQLIERFGAYSFDDFLDRMRRIPGVLHPEVTTVEVEYVKDEGVGPTELLQATEMTRKSQAAFKALLDMNAMLAQELYAAGHISGIRELLLGKQKKGATAAAWTDGRTTITASLKYLKAFETGLEGVRHWLHVLVHEYCHDQDDSESHDHGEVFYRKYHDVTLDEQVHLASLTQEGLRIYLRKLSELGLPKPHTLTRQLKA